MKLSKKDCIIISELNEAYNWLFQKWTSSWGENFLKKMKLSRVIAKNFEEQKRWFLKSELDYKKSAHFFLSEFQQMDYEELHREITKILLNLDEL